MARLAGRPKGAFLCEATFSWPSDVQQCRAAADQAKNCVFLRRAEQTCELRNVAPAEGGRPPKNSELRNDNKAFRPQFDDQRE